jgi:hypothetical protein
MKEIIDFTESKPDDFVYLKKSAILYKIYGGLVVFSILMSVLIKPLIYRRNSQYADMLDLLVGLPLLAMFVLAPFGLYYSWKSYKRKEGFSKRRFKYMLGHLFICLIMVVILGVVLADVASLLS